MMNRKQFLVLLISTVVFSFIGGMVAVELFQGSMVSAQSSTDEKKSVQVQAKFSFDKEFKLPEGHFIGAVENGKLTQLVPKPAFVFPIRLTGIQMQEARPAESMEIQMDQYEGKVIMITGHHGGNWIYRANVVDSGGPLIKALVQKVFSGPKKK